jgi:hypothetical protein
LCRIWTGCSAASRSGGTEGGQLKSGRIRTDQRWDDQQRQELFLPLFH